MNQNASDKATGSSSEKGRTGAEWAMFAITLALVLGVAGTVIGLWLFGESRPPGFALTPHPPITVGETVHVPLEVRNTGSTTAARVRIVAYGGEGRPPLIHTVDYISGGETRQVTFVLPQPQPNLVFSVESFHAIAGA